MIRLEGISKTFRIVRREPGLAGAAKSLFHREYREVHALREVSFEIPEGALIGCIGPNGAGKSTTIKIMSGILMPDSGSCTIMGFVPFRDRPKYVQHIGVVFGQRTQLWWDVPVRDSFALLRDIYRVPEAAFRAAEAKYTEILGLSDLLDTPLRQLSLGQRMRCELAGSLLHKPRLLFLDEPTIGLDAVSKQAVRGFIRELNRDEGTTVILTTHDTADLEALANRILLLGHGQLLFDGALADLRGRYDTHRVLNIAYTGVDAAPVPTGSTLLEESPGQATFSVPVAEVTRAITFLASSLPLTDVRVEEKPVDEVIATLYRDLNIQ